MLGKSNSKHLNIVPKDSRNQYIVLVGHSPHDFAKAYMKWDGNEVCLLSPVFIVFSYYQN